MKKLLLLALALTAIAALGGTAAAEAAPLPKVTICHIPPGNPANAHTITISENAWPAHLNNHGDLLGSCDANCDILCDDGNACTNDVDMSAESCACLPAPAPADCSDGSVCTTDSCDVTSGMCVNEPIPNCGSNVCDPSDPAGYALCCDLDPTSAECDDCASFPEFSSEREACCFLPQNADDPACLPSS